MNINKRIELNRAASINNFEQLFGILENAAWGIVLERTKMDRIQKSEEYDEKNELVKEEVIRLLNDLFDLQQAMDSMPKDVKDEVWKRWCEVAAEREAIMED